MEENVVKQGNKFVIKIIPLIIINLFIAVSLLLFKFGFISWKMDKVNLTIMYMILVYFMFSLGYIMVVKKSKDKELTENQKEANFFYARLIFIIGITISIVYYLAWIYFTFGKDFGRFLLAPGAAYDYAEYLQKLYTSGNGLEYPMTFRWITRVNTVMGGFTVSAIPLGMYLFNRLSKYEKAGIAFLICLYIIRSFLFGEQSAFLILILMVFVIIMVKSAYYFINADDKESKKKKIRYLLINFGIISILGICFLGIMLLFQNDRVKQRVIRNSLYTMTMEEYGKVSSKQLQDNLLRSIEIRIGKQIFDIERIDLIKGESDNKEKVTDDSGMGEALDQNTAMDSDGNGQTSKSEDNKSTQEDIINKGNVNNKNQTLESNFTVIDKYFKTNKDSWFYKKLPSIAYGIQSVEMYLTQGYGALALAMEHNFDWTYCIGSSKIFTSIVEGITGNKIFERTYVYKNEAINGWSSQTYFNSLYTWLASDYTFLGVIVLFGLLGMFFAKVWLDVIIKKNIVAVVMLYLLMFELFMASAVNTLFQSLGSFIFSWGVIALYIISILLIKKGDAFYEKFISKNRG